MVKSPDLSADGNFIVNADGDVKSAYEGVNAAQFSRKRPEGPHVVHVEDDQQPTTEFQPSAPTGLGGTAVEGAQSATRAFSGSDKPLSNAEQRRNARKHEQIHNQTVRKQILPGQRM